MRSQPDSRHAAYSEQFSYCYHLRFGVVDSINTPIKAVLRRARQLRWTDAASEAELSYRPSDSFPRDLVGVFISKSKKSNR
jgi:hypothetical protein